MNKLIEARDAVAELSTEIRELSELETITAEQDARLDEAVAELPAREALVVTLEARQAVIDRAALAPAPASFRPRTSSSARPIFTT